MGYYLMDSRELALAAKETRSSRLAIKFFFSGHVIVTLEYYYFFFPHLMISLMISGRFHIIYPPFSCFDAYFSSVSISLFMQSVSNGTFFH